jgi:N utilization substance protein A
VNGETKKHEGALSALGVSAAEAEGIILDARIKAGWIEAPAAEPAEDQDVEPAETKA